MIQFTGEARNDLAMTGTFVLKTSHYREDSKRRWLGNLAIAYTHINNSRSKEGCPQGSLKLYKKVYGFITDFKRWQEHTISCVTRSYINSTLRIEGLIETVSIKIKNLRSKWV